MNIVQMLRNEQDVTKLHSGQVIFHEGAPGDVMYAVLDGEVNIVHNHEVIETIPAGGIFGELALIDDQPRSASAVAKTDAQIARITEKRFEFLVQYSPQFAIEVMRTMARRLRRRMG
jgi:CRP/FNR family transcriptional regulator, cyclic AMP receptor protein